MGRLFFPALRAHQIVMGDENNGTLKEDGIMLESALIAYGSPTLARLKAGSLFAVPCEHAALKEEMRRLNAILAPRGVRVTVLQSTAGRTLVYLYREQALREALNCPDARKLLEVYGYRDFTIHAALRMLRTRMEASSGFPHEIGVFLGYPLEDVIGFIRNGGRNCLCSGCWKAYVNEREARRTFARLHKCRAVYARLFSEGYSLTRLTVRTT